MIATGDIPADIVHATDDVVAFRDINPQAPVHILVIPRTHYANAFEAAQQDPAILGHVLAAATDVAEAEELGGGYRCVINTGGDGGQTVDHVHLHLLGGRHLAWPPG